MQIHHTDHAAKTGLIVDRTNVTQNHSNRGRSRIALLSGLKSIKFAVIALVLVIVWCSPEGFTAECGYF
jgi:hypothetical protein